MRFSNIYLTVDAIIFRIIERDCCLLLIKRKKDPFKGKWALPGGFVEQDEDLEAAALRELREETGLNLLSMEQLRAFGNPSRDPRHHTVSVVFVAFVGADVVATAGDDAGEADWFPIKNLPPVAFDHSDIITFAINKYGL